MLIDLNQLIEKYNLKITGVLHGGAHHGEESLLYEQLNINNVIWVEANPEKAEFCAQKLKSLSNNVIVNEAISDVNGEEVEFNITNNGESSSILKLKYHKDHYPDINIVNNIVVKTKRLDTIIDEHGFDMKQYNFVNLDLQGVELRAIKGLGNYLDHIDYVYTEINRSELYEGCDQINVLDSYLESKGFRRVETVWTHADWGDAFYIRLPKIKVVVTSYNNENWVQTNIESILEQSYTNFDVLFIDDCSTDQTYELALNTINGDSRFKTIQHTENKSKSYSFMTYVSDFVNDDDIVAFVDGDDWIAYSNVFEMIVNDYIKTGCWVAYSKLICYPSLIQSNVQGNAYSTIEHTYNLYRKLPFISSHLKTMKGFIFKQINSNDFKFNGEWIRFADDVALMSAAMEMSPTDKINVLGYVGYVYNESQSNTERTTLDYHKHRNHEDYVRNLKPYSVLKDNSEKYVSPRMLGRLGNQMFEIATAYSYAIDNNCSCKVSTKNGIYSSAIGEVGSPLDYKNTIFKNIEFIEQVDNADTWTETEFKYNPISYKFDKNLYIEGQFQSEKYFNHNRDSILNLFKPSESDIQYIQSKYGDLLRENTVSLHVRRGDYLATADHHPTCSMEYYNNALSKFPEIDHVLVFSDDIEWAKTNFSDKKFYIIEGERDYIDLYIMSLCKNNIIANSSFSWWGAWLNQNDDKIVIAPDPWFGPSLQHHDTSDLIPNTWIKIQNTIV